MTDDQLNAMWYYAVGSGDPTAGNAHLRFARAVLAAQPAPAVPDGWVMVPREPTVEMRRAAARWLTHYHVMRAGDKTNAITDAWIAMIAASPGSAPATPAVPVSWERLRTLMDGIPTREEFIGGQRQKYVAKEEVMGWLYECQLRAEREAVPAVREPLTDEQIDEIWDGTFDSADPKRQLSFRQIITRAIEAHHGITGDSNG